VRRNKRYESEAEIGGYTHIRSKTTSMSFFSLCMSSIISMIGSMVDAFVVNQVIPKQ
jgi:hypothetical protein